MIENNAQTLKEKEEIRKMGKSLKLRAKNSLRTEIFNICKDLDINNKTLADLTKTSPQGISEMLAQNGARLPRLDISILIKILPHLLPCSFLIRDKITIVAIDKDEENLSIRKKILEHKNSTLNNPVKYTLITANTARKFLEIVGNTFDYFNPSSTFYSIAAQMDIDK